MNQDRVESMKQMRAQFFTLKEIGGRFGITRERVRQLIGNSGHTLRKQAIRNDVDDLRNELYILNSATIEDVAARYRVPTSAVSHIVGPRWKYLYSLGLRRCYICKATKTIEEFGTSNNFKQIKVSGVCKECNRERVKFYKKARTARQSKAA